MGFGLMADIWGVLGCILGHIWTVNGVTRLIDVCRGLLERKMRRLLTGLVLAVSAVSTAWAQASRRVEIQYYSDAEYEAFYPDSTITIFYNEDGLELSREVVTREEFMGAVMDSIWALTASAIADSGDINQKAIIGGEKVVDCRGVDSTMSHDLWRGYE
jgi:hypothetical protein